MSFLRFFTKPIKDHLYGNHNAIFTFFITFLLVHIFYILFTGFFAYIGFLVYPPYVWNEAFMEELSSFQTINELDQASCGLLNANNVSDQFFQLLKVTNWKEWNNQYGNIISNTRFFSSKICILANRSDEINIILDIILVFIFPFYSSWCVLGVIIANFKNIKNLKFRNLTIIRIFDIVIGIFLSFWIIATYILTTVATPLNYLIELNLDDTSELNLFIQNYRVWYFSKIMEPIDEINKFLEFYEIDPILGG